MLCFIWCYFKTQNELYDCLYLSKNLSRCCTCNTSNIYISWPIYYFLILCRLSIIGMFVPLQFSKHWKIWINRIHNLKMWRNQLNNFILSILKPHFGYLGENFNWATGCTKMSYIPFERSYQGLSRTIRRDTVYPSNPRNWARYSENKFFAFCLLRFCFFVFFLRFIFLRFIFLRFVGEPSIPMPLIIYLRCNNYLFKRITGVVRGAVLVNLKSDRSNIV